MKPPRLACILLVLLSIGASACCAETTNSTVVIPFKYQFECTRASQVHSNYNLRLYYSPKSESEITASCVLLRGGELVGRFPLRLQRNDKDNYIWFSVICLLNDLADEGRLELYVRDLETDKTRVFMLPLKDAKHGSRKRLPSPD